MDIVDNAKREAPQRETTSIVAPRHSEVWVRAKQIKDTLKFCYECQSKSRTCFFCVINRRVRQFSISLLANGGGHLGLREHGRWQWRRE